MVAANQYFCLDSETLEKNKADHKKFPIFYQNQIIGKKNQ